MFTCYLTQNTSKNRQTGAEENYPAVMITDGSRYGTWRCSSRHKWAMILDLIKQSGGDPSKVMVKSESGDCALDSDKVAVFLANRTTTSTGDSKLPKGVTLA